MPPKRNFGAEDVDEAEDDEVERLISRDDTVADDDDDFFLKGPSSKKTVRFASDKLKDVRVQIAEVTDVMRTNVRDILARGDHLDSLQDRSDGLAATSDQFQATSTRLRRHMWWQDTKAKIFICLLVLLVVVVLLIVLVPRMIKLNSDDPK